MNGMANSLLDIRPLEVFLKRLSGGFTFHAKKNRFSE